MGNIFLRNGEEMLLDDEDLHLFEGVKLYAIRSRNSFYAYFGKSGAAHRLIMNVNDTKVVIDHINGNGLDNRKINLRAVSSSVNVKNRRNSRSPKNNLPPGIFPEKNRFFVQITENYKKIFIGRFDKKEDALIALNKKRVELGRPEVYLPPHQFNRSET